jgi:hypothetical protein
MPLLSNFRAGEEQPSFSRLNGKEEKLKIAAIRR